MYYTKNKPTKSTHLGDGVFVNYQKAGYIVLTTGSDKIEEATNKIVMETETYMNFLKYMGDKARKLLILDQKMKTEDM